MNTVLTAHNAHGGTVTEKPKCPECGTAQLYYRKKTKDFACKSCPWTGNLKVQKGKKGK